MGPAILMLAAALIATDVAAQFVEPVSACENIEQSQSQPEYFGDTTPAFGNQYDLQTCDGMPAAALLPASGQSSEQVVQLRAASDCTLAVTVTGEFAGPNQMDPTVYLTDACPASGATPTLMDANCLGAADATGGLGTENFSVDLIGSVDYFLFVDGFLSAIGPYSVALSGCQLISNTDPSTDGDFIPDLFDNCTNVANVDQRDTDDDGHGNLCDADLNNDCIVNVIDLGMLRSRFFGNDEDADLTGDGIVNVQDLGLLRINFFGPPGPSGPPSLCD